MRRWIDADVYEKFIKAKYADREKAEDIKEQMLFDLSCQPTVYDVDAVVEQLENERKFWENAYDRDIGKEKARSYAHAIEIVKGGGVDGN